MAHNATHRRKPATADTPSISQNPGKRHPNPSTTSTSTIYNLTNHFSRLHPNPNSNPNPNPKPTNSHNPQKQKQKQKQIDSPLQVKALSKSANMESWKQGRRVVLERGKSKSLVVVEDVPAPVVESKRRSFGDVQVELGSFMVTNCAKVVSADMPAFMQIHAVSFARKVKDSLEKFTSKNLASSLKKEFDGVYGPAWHCIVGTSFGSFVTHSVAGFLYFSLDQKLYVLLFKTAVQRAD